MKTGIFALVLELPIIILSILFLVPLLEQHLYPWPYYRPTLILLAFFGWAYRLILFAKPKSQKK
jgi:hypothetical protein